MGASDPARTAPTLHRVGLRAARPAGFGPCPTGPALRVLTPTSHEASPRRLRSARLHDDLRKQPEAVRRKRAGRLMYPDSHRAHARKRFKCTAMSEHDQTVAPNVSDPHVVADPRNQRWVADAWGFLFRTSAKLNFPAGLHPFSRFLGRSAVSPIQHRHRVITAPRMTLTPHRPPLALPHPSDHGNPFPSDDYRATLTAHPMLGTPPWSARSQPFGLEFANHFDSSGQPKMQLFDFVHVLSNPAAPSLHAPPDCTASAPVLKSRRQPEFGLTPPNTDL